MSEQPSQWAMEAAEEFVGGCHTFNESRFRADYVAIIAAFADAARAEGRREALEEAALFLETHSCGHSVRSGWVVEPRADSYGGHAGEGYANAIRALMDKEPSR